MKSGELPKSPDKNDVNGKEKESLAKKGQGTGWESGHLIYRANYKAKSRVRRIPSNEWLIPRVQGMRQQNCTSRKG